MRLPCRTRITAGNIHFPQVHGGRAIHDPVGQHPAHACRGHDPNGIHPRGDEQAIHSGRLPHQGLGISREAFRPVHEMLNAHGFQRGNEVKRSFHEGRELVPVFGHFEEGAVSFGAMRVPALGIGFEPADDELTRITLDVDPPIKIAQHGKACECRVRLRDDIHVLDRLQGERKPRRGSKALGPGPCTKCDAVGPDLGPVRQADTGDARAIAQQTLDPGPFADLDPGRFCRAGIGHAQVNRVHAGIFGNLHDTHEPGRVDRWHGPGKIGPRHHPGR